MYAQAPTQKVTVKDGAFYMKPLKLLVMFRKMLTNLSQFFLQIWKNVGQISPSEEACWSRKWAMLKFKL